MNIEEVTISGGAAEIQPGVWAAYVAITGRPTYYSPQIFSSEEEALQLYREQMQPLIDELLQRQDVQVVSVHKYGGVEYPEERQ